MKNSTVKEIRGQHGLECLSIQVSIMKNVLSCTFVYRLYILQNHTI